MYIFKFFQSERKYDDCYVLFENSICGVYHGLHPTSTDFFCCIRFVEQVQEKKVKKISEMNVDPSKTVGNGSVASSSNLSSPKTHLANGGCSSFSSLSNDISFPPEGYPSLRLPQVVVLGPFYAFMLCPVLYLASVSFF